MSDAKGRSALRTDVLVTYHALGNLTGVVQSSQAIDYVVDGRGHRVQKKVNGTPTQGFLWDERLRIIAELDGAGTLVSRFVYGRNMNVPDYVVRGTDSYRLITDHLGSVRLVVKVTCVDRCVEDKPRLSSNSRAACKQVSVQETERRMGPPECKIIPQRPSRVVICSGPGGAPACSSE